MPRGREPANAVAARPRPPCDGESACFRALVLGAAALVLACSGRGDGATSGTQRPAGGRRSNDLSPFSGIGHVGNQVKGIDAMPDYDDEARLLRERVAPRLPEPLPSPRGACVAMLDAARQFYVDTEGEGSQPVAMVDATRERDLAGCLEHTSPAAASCVAVLMAEFEGEFPWLLDQCSRAFPEDDGGAP